MRALHFLFAWRYFKAKKSTNAVNIIAWVSIVAIIIGTAALILVLSVFNGFEGIVKSLYSSFYPDIKISPTTGKVITVSKAQLQQLRGLSAVKNYSLVVEEKGVLENAEGQRSDDSSKAERPLFLEGETDGPDEGIKHQTVVVMKGVDSNYHSVVSLANNDVNDSYDFGDAKEPLFLLGAGVESALNNRKGPQVFPVNLLNIYLPKKNTGTELLDATKDIGVASGQVSGTFVIQQEFDNKYAITNLAFIKEMLGYDSTKFSAVEIAIKDPGKPEEAKEEIKKIFGDTYKVQTRYEQNQSLYAVMQAEKWVIYAVLSLILVVAAFTMIGALTMLVLEKQKDVKVLHALGADKSFIQKIFLNEGMLLALIGGGLGMLLALIIAVLQINFKLIPLQGGSFLIDYFPVKLNIADFLLVGATVFVIALIASFIPARKAVANQDLSLRSE